MPSPFIVEKVTDESQLRRVFRLRYKVYCEEWDFEKAENHPDGLEMDIYDKHSVHFLAKDVDGKSAGTIRLILDSDDGFPVERYCGVEIKGVDRSRIAEISRLAINKNYRRRVEDRFIYGPDEERRAIGSFEFDDPAYRRRFTNSHFDNYYSRRHNKYYNRRKRHEVLIALCKAIYLESKDRGLTHWYAIMTKGLHFLLSGYGFRFEPAGEPVDYHGIRTPYLGEIERIERFAEDNHPDIYEEFTRELMERRT